MFSLKRFTSICTHEQRDSWLIQIAPSQRKGLPAYYNVAFGEQKQAEKMQKSKGTRKGKIVCEKN